MNLVIKMMVSFYFTTIPLGILIIISAALPDEKTMAILNECKVTEKASDDDVSQIAAQKLPTGPNAPCFLACFYEHLGVIRDEVIQRDQLKSMLLKDAKDNSSAINRVNNIVDECKSIVDRGRCQFASKLRSCVDKSALIQGLNQS